MKEASHSLKKNCFPGDKSKDAYLSHSPDQLLNLQ